LVFLFELFAEVMVFRDGFVVRKGALDAEVAVEIRGQMVKARVVALPFYKRAKKST